MIKQPKIISKERCLKAETLGSGTVSLKAQSQLRWWAKRMPFLEWDKAQSNILSPTGASSSGVLLTGDVGTSQNKPDPVLSPIPISRLFSCIPEETQWNSSIPLLLPGITPTCTGFLYTVIRVQRRLPWERVKENNQKLPQKLLPMKVQENADNYWLIPTWVKGILAISSTEILK